jgi:hypothetical protein
MGNRSQGCALLTFHGLPLSIHSPVHRVMNAHSKKGNSRSEVTRPASDVPTFGGTIAGCTY